MFPQSFVINNAGDVVVRLHVSSDAPDMETQPLNLRWLAYNGNQTGTLNLKLSIETESIVHDTGPVRADTVSGFGQLGLNSRGFWSFQGHLHKAAFVGNHYAFAIVLEHRDPSGKAVAFVQEDTLGGTLDPRSRDSDWQQNDHSTFISDNWEAIRNTGIRWNLHISTDPIQVVEVVLLPLAVLVGAFAGIFALANDPNTDCEPFPKRRDDDPGIPVVRCEFGPGAPRR